MTPIRFRAGLGRFLRRLANFTLDRSLLRDPSSNFVSFENDISRAAEDFSQTMSMRALRLRCADD
jgi:hypothetical protein